MQVNSLKTAFCLAMLSTGIVLPGVAQSTDSTPGTVQEAPEKSKLPVYPIPKKMTVPGMPVKIDSLKLSGDKDEATVEALKKSFKLSSSGIPVKMQILKDSGKPAEHGMPEKAGAYILNVTPQEIRMIGFDDEGLFYAAQTLLQLAEQTRDGLLVPQVNIVDWPDLPFRGAIEGFYGLPWGQKGRISQFEFYGKNKLNTYIYGPKDDVFHGFSNRWREPYPEDMAKELKELVTIAKKNKVNFVWAVHPGADIHWGEADQKAAVNKFQMMYDLGFRSFAVFFDDIGGEGADPERQVEFLNYLNKEFIHKKPDVTPLIVCPTAYSGGGSHYHEVMGQKLDKDIGVMWTGSTIVSDIRTDALKDINKFLQRPAFIWWNFPVTDYVRHALFLGRTYGVDKDSLPFMQGFASNPMDKPEASKICLFSVANLTWNAEAFDSDKTWKDSIKILFPGCAEAMQTFANHNSDGGPSTHNYRREESVEIAPAVEKVLEQVRRGAPVSGMPEFARLRDEFKRIAEAPSKIRSGADNPAFLEEVEPWLVQFESLGKAGLNCLSMIEATEAGKGASLKYAMTAANLLADMQRYSKEISEVINKHVSEVTKKPSPWQKDIRPAELVIAPAVRELLDLGSLPVLSGLSGRQLGRVKPYVSTTFKEGIDKMMDADPNSYYYCKEIQKIGDFFGLDLGNVQEIRTVDIVMGRNDSDTDSVNRGQLEVSSDGKNWTPLMQETSGNYINYKGKGAKGRFVRYRATVQGIPGGKPDVWTAIRDFKVNAPSAPSAISDVEVFRNAVAEKGDKDISLRRIMEVNTLAPGKSLGISIPAGAEIGKVHINLKTPDLKWARLQVSTDGKHWTNVALADDGSAKIGWLVKGVRLVNAGKSPREVTLEEFKLELVNDGAQKDTAAASDADLTTFLSLPLTGEKAVVPCNYPRANEVILLTNGEEAEVHACGADGRWISVGKLHKGKLNTTLKLKDVKKPVKAVGFTGKAGTVLNVFEVLWK